jgi:hypothetical protein
MTDKGDIPSIQCKTSLKGPKSKPTYLSLHIEYITLHTQHGKHRIQVLFHYCTSMDCHGKVFTEPLPSNDSYHK